MAEILIQRKKYESRQIQNGVPLSTPVRETNEPEVLKKVLSYSMASRELPQETLPDPQPTALHTGHPNLVPAGLGRPALPWLFRLGLGSALLFIPVAMAGCVNTSYIILLILAWDTSPCLSPLNVVTVNYSTPVSTAVLCLS